MASFSLAFHYVAALTTRRSKVDLQINALNREIVKHQLPVRLSPYTPAMFPAYLANNLNETRASYRKSHVPLFIEAALLTYSRASDPMVGWYVNGNFGGRKRRPYPQREVGMKAYIQRLGRALMLPVACLPAAALFLGIGYWIDPSGWGGSNVVAAYLCKTGGAILQQLGLSLAEYVSTIWAGCSPLVSPSAWLATRTAPRHCPHWSVS